MYSMDRTRGWQDHSMLRGNWMWLESSRILIPLFVWLLPSSGLLVLAGPFGRCDEAFGSTWVAARMSIR